MTSAMYEVHIDFDKDSQYAHALSDVSSYALRLAWNNGMTSSGQEFASPARLTLTLDNSMGDFNLEETTATFYGLFKKGLLVQVRAIFNSTMHTLFVGKLAEPPTLDTRNYGDQTFDIQVTDMMLELLDAEFNPRLQINTLTGTALRQPFDAGAVALPYASDYWIMDYSVLGTNTVPVDATRMITFDAGQTVLAYVGDLPGQERIQRAQTFLRQMVEAEAGGRFWFDTRTGRFVFHDRHHDLNPTIVQTLTANDFDDGRYIVQDKVINQITVGYQPRGVGTSGSIIWSSSDVIEIAAGQTRNLNARYADPNNPDARIGAMDFLPLVAGTDYLANRNANGLGVNMLPFLTVGVEFGATAAKIGLSNIHPSRPLFVTLLRVKGTPLTTFSRQQVEAGSASSIAEHDVRPDSRDLSAVDDQELAQQYADGIVQQYQTPMSRYETIQFAANKTDARMTSALTRTIGDPITVQQADYDHDRDYIIVGERHQVEPGGEHSHEVVWILKPIERIRYWILDTSVLGTDTIPAF